MFLDSDTRIIRSPPTLDEKDSKPLSSLLDSIYERKKLDIIITLV